MKVVGFFIGSHTLSFFLQPTSHYQALKANEEADFFQAVAGENDSSFQQLSLIV